jgi:transposase
MSYPTQYRKRTIEYRREGHTLEETSATFKVCVPTIRDWTRKFEADGSLEKKLLQRGFKKIDPEKLKAYIAEKPDAYLSEIAEAFGCSDTAAHKALKRLGFARKKRRSASASRTQPK